MEGMTDLRAPPASNASGSGSLGYNRARHRDTST